MITYWKLHLYMLPNVPYLPINDNTSRTDIFRSGRHEPTPEGGVETFRLLDVHNFAVLIEIDKMLRR